MLRDYELDPALEFMRLLWEVSHALGSASERLLRTRGITTPQRLVLRFLGTFSRLATGELAQLLHRHSTTLTGLLNQLEGKGLVRWSADPKDGRRSLYQITEAGEKISAPLEGTVEDAIRRALSSSSQADVEALRRVLGAIVDELGKAASR